MKKQIENIILETALVAEKTLNWFKGVPAVSQELEKTKEEINAARAELASLRMISSAMVRTMKRVHKAERKALAEKQTFEMVNLRDEVEKKVTEGKETLRKTKIDGLAAVRAAKFVNEAQVKNSDEPATAGFIPEGALA
ncbi:MAG: hypothetical protein ACK5DE_02435 [Bacteroidota bacterium]|jgi:hypothetical protein